MEKSVISEGMIRNVKRIYRETRSKVRVDECFWTAREVKQGCLVKSAPVNVR